MGEMLQRIGGLAVGPVVLVTAIINLGNLQWIDRHETGIQIAGSICVFLLTLDISMYKKFDTWLLAIIGALGIVIWIAAAVVFGVNTPTWVADVIFVGMILLVVALTIRFSLLDIKQFIWLMILIMALVIIMYAVMYWRFGLIEIINIHDANDVTTITMEARKTFDLRDSFYFAIGSWTTLTYSDLVPTREVRFIATMEGLTGYLYLAIFVSFASRFLTRNSATP